MLAALAVLVGALLAGHALLPAGIGRLGSLVQTFLPWLGLAVPVLLVLAVLRRSGTALVALALPGTAWLGLFGPALLPGGDDRPGDLTVVQHNLSDTNADPTGTARALARVRPDLIGVQELTAPALPAYSAVLAGEYPYRSVHGTVGLWSRYPLVDDRLLDIRPAGLDPDWNRGLRATVRMPGGDIAVYVAHLPSIRLGLPDGFGAARRDESARLLARALAAERLETVILLGDLNSTVHDRGLAPVGDLLPSTGPAFPFSWPTALPVARIDQVMARSASVTDLWALPPTGSDHLPIAARLRL
ncbi:endonuclease/exonuclease/phosphatase family protein [Plantactinospora sp. BB1]|uniref:endonuclease/exonuclease/phosphatase family protein n=1 Tax=Plantactinospora sp. BB1 TaxID=2071627 RepID=UPI000D1786CB|nr:endonuclease/exonuclease/phosphatase family protein [Plantactinospora sp. BB1]AVT38052.1 endonuclease [Plantactinospora sp. BB1]